MRGLFSLPGIKYEALDEEISEISEIVDIRLNLQRKIGVKDDELSPLAERMKGFSFITEWKFLFCDGMTDIIFLVFALIYAASDDTSLFLLPLLYTIITVIGKGFLKIRETSSTRKTLHLQKYYAAMRNDGKEDADKGRIERNMNVISLERHRLIFEETIIHFQRITAVQLTLQWTFLLYLCVSNSSDNSKRGLMFD